MTDSDTDYYLKRAEQEEVLAIQADHPKAAAAHRDMSVRYSASAVIAIVYDQDSTHVNAMRAAGETPRPLGGRAHYRMFAGACIRGKRCESIAHNLRSDANLSVSGAV